MGTGPPCAFGGSLNRAWRGAETARTTACGGGGRQQQARCPDRMCMSLIPLKVAGDSGRSCERASPRAGRWGAGWRSRAPGRRSLADGDRDRGAGPDGGPGGRVLAHDAEVVTVLVGDRGDGAEHQAGGLQDLVPSDLTASAWPYPTATRTTLSRAPMSPYRDLLIVVPSPSWPVPLSPQLATTWDCDTVAAPRACAGTAPAVPATPDTSAAQPARPASRRVRNTFMVSPH
jgi:hypothetical protein